MDGYRCPRMLADARVEGAAGGTGTRIPAELALAVKRRGPLWLAGGIGHANVGAVVRDFSPELIDASSGLESSPGVKDLGRLEAFFGEVERHAGV